jgi:hypothetical protein
VYLRDQRHPRPKSALKTNAVQASHPDRIRTWFPACLVTAWRRNDRFSPSALHLRSAAFAKAVCRFAILRSPTRNRCGGHRPCPRSRLLRAVEQDGRRPQCPGNQFRACARLLESPSDSPSRVTGCRWLCRNHSARSGTLTFSLNPLSATLLRLATQKSPPLVQNLWTMCLPCGSPRKTKNNFGHSQSILKQYQ